MLGIWFTKTASDLRERNNDNLVRRFCFFIFCSCAFHKRKSLVFSDSTRLMTAAALHYSTGSTQLHAYVQFGIRISTRLSQNIIMWRCKYVLILLTAEGTTRISEGSQLPNKTHPNSCLSKFPGRVPSWRELKNICNTRQKKDCKRPPLDTRCNTTAYLLASEREDKTRKEPLPFTECPGPETGTQCLGTRLLTVTLVSSHHTFVTQVVHLWN